MVTLADASEAVNDRDAFEAMMMREDRPKGVYASFDFISDALQEISGFFKRTGSGFRVHAGHYTESHPGQNVRDRQTGGGPKDGRPAAIAMAAREPSVRGIVRTFGLLELRRRGRRRRQHG